MSALYRYLLTSVLLSQRYLPPTLIFLAAMAVGTTSDNGPLQSSYSFCVLAMLVCTTWLTVSIVNHEDPTQRKITLVMIGSSLRVLTMTVAVVVTWCVPLLLIGLVYPIVTGKHVVTAGDLAVGAAAQLGAAMIGIAIGLLCSRLVIPRIGVAMLTAAAAILAVLLLRWISPIRPIMTVLSDEKTAGANAVPLTLLALLSAVLLAAAVFATNLLADRKE
ncbi:hypothetical protein [Kribbella speibonae]|uniref:ABC transporter n=1 Tax=Kribbella speibonae TaxID=1572660 RepID=A0A4R0IAD7_9ACTN|nr:hypothetical protein [Kribbella speibonae]TCC24502.1 hypothetical protein E0H58_09675 [Kribbella speibonae]TCC30003.1 hypothetical protein E0H92_39100 [Kribbella speibonae]